MINPDFHIALNLHHMCTNKKVNKIDLRFYFIYLQYIQKDATLESVLTVTTV